MQMYRLERTKNGVIRIIRGCTRDTAVATMRYLLECLEFRRHMCQVGAYLHISTDKGHPLREELTETKGTKLKRGKSWLCQAEDVI